MTGEEEDPWAGAGVRGGPKWRKVHLNLGDKALLRASSAALAIDQARGGESIMACAAVAQAWAAIAQASYAAANVRFRPDGPS